MLPPLTDDQKTAVKAMRALRGWGGPQATSYVREMLPEEVAALVMAGRRPEVAAERHALLNEIENAVVARRPKPQPAQPAEVVPQS